MRMPSAICVLLVLGVAADGQAVTGALWSTDRSAAPCRTARVEMIVGGVPESSSGCRGSAGPDREARVDASIQRMRDEDRRGILLQEVAHERELLARLASTPDSDANRQAAERARANLAALQRELARTP